MTCPTQRQTRRGRPIVCQGSCNPRNRRFSKSPDDKVDTDLEECSLGGQVPVTLTELFFSFPEDLSRRQNSEKSQSGPQFQDPKGNKVENVVETISRLILKKESITRGSVTTLDTNGASNTIERNTLGCFSQNAPVATTTFFNTVANLSVILSFLSRLTKNLGKQLFALTEYLVPLGIFIGAHVLLVYLAWDNPVYQSFLSAEFCGFLTFVIWFISGSIPI